jgi:anti-sigma factor RsiW
MSEGIQDIERLISRYLDGECTSAERRELEDRTRRDPAAAELLEEYAALDRQFHSALRETLLRPAARPRPVPLWERGARVGILAVAACLAVLLWFSPSNRTTERGPAKATVHPNSSWFAVPPNAGDALVERSVQPDRPASWVGKPETDWIVIPTEKKGEFLVIQVDSIEASNLREPQDF